MNAAAHPDVQHLTAYLLGKLSWAELEKVEIHLGNCVDCRSRVGDLEGSADSFVGRLRGATPPPAEDAALAKLLAGARALTQQTASFAGFAAPKMSAGLEVLRELGRGGLGIVYLARHPVLKDLRAIKRPLSKHGLERDQLFARFHREVRAVGALRHDHIVRAHDAGADDEGPFLVMEYLDGEPLSQVLGRRCLSPGEACELVRQAALGLQAAHERGLIHRDVKPSNLMLARANSGARVVVIDWGLVKRIGEGGPPDGRPAAGATSSGSAMGTPDFIAPEQVRDARSVNIRADVYSLGATLYCLLAGQPPFYGRSELQKLLAHESEEFPPLGERRPDVPQELLAVLHKMVEKDPVRRYCTPGKVANALQPFCCEESCLLGLLQGDTVVSANAPTVTVLTHSRPRWRVWLAVAAASVLLIAALGVMLRGKPSSVKVDPEAPSAILGDGPAAPASMSGHRGHCSSLVFTPDGREAVSESGGGKVYVWDLRNRCLKHSWIHMFGNEDQYLSGMVAVSPDGSVVAAAGLNSLPKYMLLLSLFDPRTGERLGKDYAFARLSHTLAFSPDSSRLAVVEVPGFLGLPSPRIRLIEISTGRFRHIPCGSSINCLAFTPDGKSLASCGNEKSIRLWNLESNRQEREFAGHTGAVDQVGFSTDGKRLFSASIADRTLQVWDNVPDGKAIKSISIGDNTAKMTCAAFHPAGRALTGHKDGTVVLWDLETGAELKHFTHKGDEVTAVAISPDAEHALAALSTDHLVYLYRLPPRARR